MTLPVAIVGGGWAGCAAAVTLADAGVPVLLFEAGPVLGGRARRVEIDGLPLDNGQHLMLGAYRETLSLLRRVHGPATPPPVIRRPLEIVPFAGVRSQSVTIVTRRAPGRLGLGDRRSCRTRPRSASALPISAGCARWARDGWHARSPRETVAKMLAPLPPRVVRELWTPLCLAALNTPVRAASASVFANVLRSAFGSDGTASDFIVPTTDLSALLPERASAYVRMRNGDIRTGTNAKVVAAARDGATLAAGNTAVPVRAAIVAVGPHQLAHAFADEMLAARPELAAAIGAIEALEYEPIVTIWLGYATCVPLPAPMARLDDQPGQWVLDRPDVLARARPGERRHWLSWSPS